MKLLQVAGHSKRLVEESAAGTQVVAGGIPEARVGGMVVDGILEAGVGGMVVDWILEAVVGGTVAGGILEVGVGETAVLVGAVVVELISLEVGGTGEEDLVGLVDPVVEAGMTGLII